MKKHLIYLIVLLLFTACKPNETHISLKYHPEVKLLEKGLVWKYYKTIYRGQEHPKTDILYRKIVKNNNVLKEDIFDAGFDLVRSRDLLLADDDTWKISKNIVFDRKNNRYSSDISNNVFIDWKQDPFSTLYSTKLATYERNTQRESIAYKDTTYNNQRALSITTNIDTQVKSKTDTFTYTAQSTSVYQENLGCVYTTFTSENLRIVSELDEVISMDEFQRRSNHGKHRVGYIDTTRTMDTGTTFHTCDHFKSISDYYNDDDAQFLGGKGRLRKVLNQKLDASLLKDQDGYLSYHFVINCNGEAGWFTTVESSLDYHEKEFSAELKNHLFKILRAEKKWKPLYIDGKAKDAYVYITFKIKNGEIIELLP